MALLAYASEEQALELPGATDDLDLHSLSGSDSDSFAYTGADVLYTEEADVQDWIVVPRYQGNLAALLRDHVYDSLFVIDLAEYFLSVASNARLLLPNTPFDELFVGRYVEARTNVLTAYGLAFAGLSVLSTSAMDQGTMRSERERYQDWGVLAYCVLGTSATDLYATAGVTPRHDSQRRLENWERLRLERLHLLSRPHQ